MKPKCPKCSSEDYDLEDLTDHLAYDNIVDAMASEKDNHFSVSLTCEKCGCVYCVVFEIVECEEVPK